MNKHFEILENASSIAIFTHINTDGDAIGSSLALRKMLLNMGKQVDVFVDSSLPYHIQFLPGIECVNNKTCEKYDLHIALDAASVERLGKYKFKFGKKTSTFQIDHHATNPYFADVNIVDGTASSTCEMMYNFFVECEQTIDKDMAECLIVGMFTDTGNLTFANAKPSTFNAVADLLKIYGQSINDIIDPLNNSMSMYVFDLKKYVYDTIEFYYDNKLAIVYLDDKVFEETHTTIDDTKGLVYVPFELKSVRMATILSKAPDGAIMGSVRSKGDVPASVVAESFGGGGHKNASGFKSYEGINAIKKQIIDEAGKILL